SYYLSWPYGISFVTPFNNGNTVLGLRVDGYTDYFTVHLFNGYNDGFSTRQTLSLEANLMQVASPFDVLNFNLGYTYQFGTLETTYYSVFVSGIEAAEKMPPERHRGAGSARWKHSFSPYSTLELGYRFYLDNWAIFGHTLETRYFQYLIKKYLLLEPNARFHN